MKKMLLIFIYSIVCLFFLTSEWVYAKTMTIREIELLVEAEKKDVRSISSIRAWLDGQTVCISSNGQPKTVSVVITDMEEEVVFANTYSSSEAISIPICNVGKYQVEIHMDSKVFTGVFELE